MADLRIDAEDLGEWLGTMFEDQPEELAEVLLTTDRMVGDWELTYALIRGLVGDLIKEPMYSAEERLVVKRARQLLKALKVADKSYEA